MESLSNEMSNWNANVSGRISKIGGIELTRWPSISKWPRPDITIIKTGHKVV